MQLIQKLSKSNNIFIIITNLIIFNFLKLNVLGCWWSSGPTKFNFMQIEVKTTNITGAGTDARITARFKFYNTKEVTRSYTLNDDADNFEPGRLDRFEINILENSHGEKIECIYTIMHVHKGYKLSEVDWHITYMKYQFENETYIMNYNKWYSEWMDSNFSEGPKKFC